MTNKTDIKEIDEQNTPKTITLYSKLVPEVKLTVPNGMTYENIKNGLIDMAHGITMMQYNRDRLTIEPAPKPEEKGNDE